MKRGFVNLQWLLLGALMLYGCLIDRIGGAFTQQPEDLEKSASPAARDLSLERSRASMPRGWSIFILMSLP